VRLGGKPLDIRAGRAGSGASKLFVRRHDMQVGPAGSGALDGAVRHVRTFGPIQRAEVALAATGGETVIEIDAPATGNFRSAMSSDCSPGATAFRGAGLVALVRWKKAPQARRHTREGGYPVITAVQDF